MLVYCPIKEQQVQECDATEDELKYYSLVQKNITQLVLQIRDIYVM
jgi:hypothetical protein